MKAAGEQCLKRTEVPQNENLSLYLVEHWKDLETAVVGFGDAVASKAAARSEESGLRVLWTTLVSYSWQSRRMFFLAATGPTSQALACGIWNSPGSITTHNSSPQLCRNAVESLLGEQNYCYRGDDWG